MIYKILVTGDSGLIGSHLVDELSKKYRVYGISRTDRNLTNTDHHISLDLQDRKATATAIADIRPSIVFHLAANAAERTAQRNPIDMTSNNLMILLNVLIPAIKSGMKRFIYFSSNAVYGDIPAPYHETDIPMPHDIYAVNKLAGEQVLKILASVYNFDYVILRPHNVYGERQYSSNKGRNVIAYFMNQAMKGEEYTFVGDGSQQRNFTYVKDVVNIAVQCLEKGTNEIFNVGSTRPTTIKELSDIIQKLSQSTVPPVSIPVDKQEVKLAVPCHDKCIKTFDCIDTPIYMGLRQTWDWAKARGVLKYDREVFEL